MTNRKPRLGIIRSKEYKDNPWHFKKFVRKPETLPFDNSHDTIVFYHGSNTSDFFSEEHTNEANHQQRSVLKSKKKIPGNMNRVAGRSNIEDFTYEHDGVFGGTLETAYHYSEIRHKPNQGMTGVVWELEIPKSKVKLIIGKKCSDWLDSEIPEINEPYYHLSDSKEIIQFLGGENNSREVAIENLRKLIIKSVKKSARGGTRYEADHVQFATPYEVPIKRVTGFWPLEYSKKPLFLPKNDFVNWLYSNGERKRKLPEEKAPRNYENKNYDKEFLKILENVRVSLKNFEKTWSKLKRELEHCMVCLEEIREIESSRSKKIKFFAEYAWYRKALNRGRDHPWKRLEHCLYGKKYNGSQRDYPFLYWLEEFNQSIDSLKELDSGRAVANVERTSTTTLVGLEYLKDKNKGQKDLVKENIEGLRNSLEKIEQEEKRKIEKGLYQLENRQEVEERVEKILKQIFSQIPDLRPLERNLNQMEANKFIQLNLEKMDELAD